MAKKTKGGNPSTRGIKINPLHEKMGRAEFIQHSVMLGFQPDEILTFCLQREPEATKDKELARVIEEAIRKERCLFLQACEKSEVLKEESNALNLEQIVPEKIEFLETHIEQVNWVFGGGLPKGHLIVLAGDPGVGKSRLATCISAGLTRSGKKVYYFQGELKPSIFATMANNENPVKENFYIDTSTDIDTLKDKVIAAKPDLVVIDSVDMFKRSFSSTEARRTQAKLKQASESAHCPFLLIHHLNKQGTVKGNNDIEYLCDIVAFARNTSLQLIVKEFVLEIPRKNRCGAAGRSAVFRHTEKGVEPVKTVTHGGLKLAQSAG